MTRIKAVKTLSDNRQRFKAYSVKSLSVFGSTIRNEATETSDVDILVEFEDDARIGLFRFIELQQFLESILNCRVDLGTADTLRQPLREQVMKEAIRVA